ncbi:hypothetical protein GGR20_001004 [Devosia subaequoris]|uniref:Uncharacterized protein n=1 Tax=Devosia subaequoris TaxID=395930 RepID=A0A7W6IKQ9_9HYPH|nr:hypothetical protein [Devosia subaequoris]
MWNMRRKIDASVFPRLSVTYLTPVAGRTRGYGGAAKISYMSGSYGVQTTARRLEQSQLARPVVWKQ